MAMIPPVVGSRATSAPWVMLRRDRLPMVCVTTCWPMFWICGFSVVTTRRPPVYVTSLPNCCRSWPVT